jgi:hypothetical protein
MRRAPRSGRLSRADDAQMMLLAAVLLVIGFIALAGLVSVAQRLGEETLQEEGSVVLLQTQPLLDLIDAAVAEAEKPERHGPAALGNDALDDAVEFAMQHLARIAAGQGIILVPGYPYPPDVPVRYVGNECAGDGSGEWTVSFHVADAATQLTFHAASRAC